MANRRRRGPAGQRRVARVLGAAGEQDGVECHRAGSAKRLRHADIDAVVEGDALGLHLAHAAVDMVLLHLEVGDAVAEQPAGLRLPLEDVHLVADAGELLSAGQAGRARADRRRRACRSGCRRSPAGPSPSPRPCRRWLLDGLDGDRLFSRLSVHASSHGAGQMRPVNSGKLLVEWRLRGSLLPVVLEDEVVPVRNLVVHGAAGRAVAIRNAAIHAARRLVAQMAFSSTGSVNSRKWRMRSAGEQILLLLPVDSRNPVTLPILTLSASDRVQPGHLAPARHGRA